MNKIFFNKRQTPYCGTTYTVQNVPSDMTEEEIVEACGERYGWWVNNFYKQGTTAQFNVNFD